jgi:hypothetical protein
MASIKLVSDETHIAERHVPGIFGVALTGDGRLSIASKEIDMRSHILGIAAASAVAVPFLGSFPQPAEAASCRILIYFAEATHVTQVGTWSNCPGIKGGTGRRTPYYIATEAPELVGRPRSPGGIKLPCEFLDDPHCPHLPKPRPLNGGAG